MGMPPWFLPLISSICQCCLDNLRLGILSNNSPIYIQRNLAFSYGFSDFRINKREQGLKESMTLLEMDFLYLKVLKEQPERGNRHHPAVDANVLCNELADSLAIVHPLFQA